MNQNHERDRTVVAGSFATADEALAALSTLRADGYADDQLGWYLASAGASGEREAGGLLGGGGGTLGDILHGLEMHSGETNWLVERARDGRSLIVVRAGQRYMEASSRLEQHGAEQAEDVRTAAYATNPASAALNEAVQVAGARAAERIATTPDAGRPAEPITYRQAGSLDERGAADVAVVAPDGGTAAPDQNPSSPGTSDFVPNPAVEANAPPPSMNPLGPDASAPAAARDATAAVDHSTVVVRATPAPSAPSGAADQAPIPTSAAQPMLADMQAQRAVEDGVPREPAQRPQDDSGDVPEGTKQTHTGTIASSQPGV